METPLTRAGGHSTIYPASLQATAALLHEEGWVDPATMTARLADRDGWAERPDAVAAAYAALHGHAVGEVDGARGATDRRRKGQPMDQEQASWTALSAAFMRATHQWLDDEPKILSDPVVEGLLDPGARETVPAVEERVGRAYLTSLRAGLVLRHRFAEDELARAAAQGVGQYVLLGAGLDTFAFRQPPCAADLHLFEVDHPATQAWKRARLVAAGFTDPPNLHWVPVDFERDVLVTRLAAAGFDAARPAFFSWLGVMMYLTWLAVAAVLRVVAALPHPSTIVLDSLPPVEELTGLDHAVIEGAVAAAAERGELVRTRLRPAELVVRLRALGFSEVVLLTPEEAQARYFAGRRDGLRAAGYAALVRATV